MVAGRPRAAETGSRDQRLAAFDGDRDHGGVDPVELAGCRRACARHLVEIDRAAELPEQAGAPVLGLGALQRT